MSGHWDPVNHLIKFPMRICYVISGDLWAGAEVMIHRLLSGLIIYQDLELSVILLNEGKLAVEIRKLGIHVEVVDEERLSFFQIVKNVRMIISDFAPDIIHSHRIKENILAYFSVKNSERKIILISTQHGMPEPVKMKWKKYKDVLLSKYNIYILSTYFKKLIVVSADIKNNITNNFGIHEDKVQVIHNGTVVITNNSRKREREFFTIGSAGRFFPIKDYPLMVETAREVLKKTDKIRFELAGEGPELERIIGLIQEYKIEKYFSLKGFVDDMASFYSNIDLYMNTSFHEGLPMSILEAMSHGIPIIALNTGGLKEILSDGLHGFLLEGRDPKLIAEKCLQLFQDKEMLWRMGIASRDNIIKNFSYDKMAENYYNLYCNSV